MNYREFGDRTKETVLLLHGGGLSWWNFREVARMLEGDYHVVLPILDGHSGSDRVFTTIKDNAEEIIAFIDENLGGSVLLLGGLSLGAQIALEILCMRKNICKHAVIESAAVLPAKMTNALIKSSVSPTFGLIKNRGFSKMQFKALHIKDDLFEDYYRDTCAVKKEDMIAFMKASTSFCLCESAKDIASDVHVFTGERERRVIRKSAGIISSLVPGCRMHVMRGLYHGEFSINHAQEYADSLKQIVQCEEV